jgi:hypothetical protein
LNSYLPCWFRPVDRTLDHHKDEITSPWLGLGYKKRLSKNRDLEGTYYASLTRRIRCLEKAGYIIQISSRVSKQGFSAAVYDVCIKAYLATFLNKNSPEKLLKTVKR